jgi:hypothetical protein
MSSPGTTPTTALLEIEKRLIQQDSKSIFSFPFEVEEGTRALQICMEWSPRFSSDIESNRADVEAAVLEWGGAGTKIDDETPEDIRLFLTKIPNLLNVILVDPSGAWRGRTDRGRGGPNQPLIIAPGIAPLGFVDGPITPGQWSLDLELHAVVPPDCTVTLSVHACDPGERDEPFAEPSPTPEKRAGWYRGELHSHSVHSDGAYTVEKLVNRAKAQEMDFLALTDHNTLAGLPELAATDFPTIPGVELTTFHGHHIVLGARDLVVPWHREGERLDVNEVAERLRANGALFALSHPFAIGDPVCTGCRWTARELDPEHIDLIEVWHRRWDKDRTNNADARLFWDELWRQGHRPTAIGVRDWHNKGHEAPLPGPLPMTVIHAESLDAPDLLDGLRAGAAYMTSGPFFTFALEDSAGTTLKLGENGPLASGPVTARIAFESLDGPARVDLLHCGERVATREISGPGDVSLTHEAGNEGWYRVEIWRDDQPLAFTNHIEWLA